MTAILMMSLALTAPAETRSLPTPAEAAAGWIALFDGEAAHGWTGATAQNGALVVPPGGKAEYAVPFPSCELRVGGVQGEFQLALSNSGKPFIIRPNRDVVVTNRFANGESTIVLQAGHGNRYVIVTDVPKGATGQVRIVLDNVSQAPSSLKTIWIRPLKTEPLFNGRDLTGWQRYRGEPKRERSQFTVTPGGELRVQDGPGDLQTLEKYDDFLLQLKCKTQGDKLNSGIFFRCIANEYQQGYEAQIQNGYKNNDRTKPTDSGTGAIYRRQPARKVISKDREFFTLTVVAVGPRFHTWVDGVPVMDWVDERKPNKNARSGLRTEAGPLSIQGHDPTTDVLFKDMQIARLK